MENKQKDIEKNKNTIDLNTKTVKQTVKTTGDKLADVVKKLIKEGNVRKISIKDKDNKILATFPINYGILGIVLAPYLAIIAVIATFVTECTISIERNK